MWGITGLALAACGGGSDTPVSDQICKELGQGLTPIQMYTAERQEKYPTPQQFADHLYGHAAIGCKNELRLNDGLRGFLQAWNINPDVVP